MSIVQNKNIEFQNQTAFKKQSTFSASLEPNNISRPPDKELHIIRMVMLCKEVGHCIFLQLRRVNYMGKERYGLTLA